jgi:ferredoxin
LPTIRIHGRSETFEANLTTSILNVLMRGGFPIDTVCGGKAMCGRDLIRVLSGAQFASPKREREVIRLESIAREGGPSGQDLRLACQTYIRGDVEIEVINIRPSPRA